MQLKNDYFVILLFNLFNINTLMICRNKLIMQNQYKYTMHSIIMYCIDRVDVKKEQQE